MHQAQITARAMGEGHLGAFDLALAEAAAEHAATARLGRPARVRHLEIHYLKLAKVGPVRADVRRLAELEGGSALLRVELRDEGQDDALLSVANVLADPGSRSRAR